MNKARPTRPKWQFNVLEIIEITGSVPVLALAVERNNPLPLKIGISDELCRLAVDQGADEAAVRRLRDLVAFYCRSASYYEAAGADESMRYDLEAQPVEPVSSEHRVSSRMAFAALVQRNNLKTSRNPLPKSPNTEEEPAASPAASNMLSLGDRVPKAVRDRLEAAARK